MTTQTEPSKDQVDINVQSMEQHVHQHAAEPRDLDYRAQALSFALSARSEPYTSPAELVAVATEFEAYLRSGAAK